MRVPALLAILASLVLVNGKVRQFTFINQCSHPVWPGFQDAEPIPERPHVKLIDAQGSEKLMGFELADNTPKHIPVPDTWSGRMWARTGCKQEGNEFRCATGNCGGTDMNCITGNQLATLAEFTLQTTDLGAGPDNYDLSLVDGEFTQRGIRNR